MGGTAYQQPQQTGTTAQPADTQSRPAPGTGPGDPGYNNFSVGIGSPTGNYGGGSLMDVVKHVMSGYTSPQMPQLSLGMPNAYQMQTYQPQAPGGPMYTPGGFGRVNPMMQYGGYGYNSLGFSPYSRMPQSYFGGGGNYNQMAYSMARLPMYQTPIRPMGGYYNYVPSTYQDWRAPGEPDPADPNLLPDNDPRSPNYGQGG